MDTLRDTKPFRELMDQLCAVLREGFPASDAMKDAYWNALRDVPFAEIKANAQRIMATATKDTPLPRPASLRNRPAPCSSAPPSAAQEKAHRESMRRWREMKQRDPVAFEIEFRSARAFTELSRCAEEDPGHEEWLREYRKWEALRYAPRADQEAGVNRLLRQ